jgi:hypothetical protein
MLGKHPLTAAAANTTHTTAMIRFTALLFLFEYTVYLPGRWDRSTIPPIGVF